MVKTKAKKLTPAEQSERFKETARALGSDESPDAFDRVAKKAAPAPKGSTAKR